MCPKYDAGRAGAVAGLSPFAVDPLAVKAADLCVPLVTPLGNTVLWEATPVEPFERGAPLPFDCGTESASDAISTLTRRLLFGRRRLGEGDDPATASPLSGEAGSTGSCIGEEPDDRRRLPRTWDTEPEGGTGLGMEDSMFTVEAGAGWADWPRRPGGDEGLDAERTVLADCRGGCGVDGSSEVVLGRRERVSEGWSTSTVPRASRGDSFSRCCL